jgi:hypothetical protein
MRSKWNVAGILAAALVLGLPAAYGQEREAVEKQQGAPIVVTGENICLGCTLKKESGAAAQCSVFGHKHVLRVAQASLDGKDAPDLKGKILNYLPTDKSKDLIDKHHGETLTVAGKVYADARVLEVASVEPTGTTAEGSSTKEPQGSSTKKAEHPEHPK